MKSILNQLEIENLRSIQKTDLIKILPITVLVGKNSAGKSTFARSFPLLRQSTETKKRAPILWFGDRVDFGSFEESVSKTLPPTSAKEIFFTFLLNISNEFTIWTRRADSGPEETEIKAKIGVTKAGDGLSHASTIEISAFDYEIKLHLGEKDTLEEMTVGEKKWQKKENQMARVSYGAVLPIFNFLKRSNSPKESSTVEYLQYSPFDDDIAEIFSKPQFESIKSELLAAIKRAPLLKRGYLSNYILNDFLFNLYDVSKSTRNMISRRLKSIEELVFASKINALCELINSGLRNYYGGVKYIEPLRATAQRYYRKQELAVDEIDSKGENLAMFLDNLTSAQLKQFNLWTQSNFGFSANTRKNGGHVEIVIREENSNQVTNLADIGFGFSQILPVITQIWYSTRLKSRRQTNTIVIEQPELHLHPAFQAKLADVFASTISTKDLRNQFIIETHSNHIINRFGQLISLGKLDKDMVQILIFDKNNDSETVISRSGFDDEGYLIDWPYGFFEPEM